jgi:hypothetical protein
VFESNPELHRCRNPRCKTWLKEPVDNRRDAFCCSSCEVGFYRTHCRVCEKEFGETKRNSRRELCGRRQCRNQFRSFRGQFFSVWCPSATGASKPEKSLTKSTPKTGIKSDRAWRQVAGPDDLSPSALHCATVGAEEVLRQSAINNLKSWNDAAWIQPHHPPVNILAGYKFPAAPDIDLGAPAESPTLNRLSDSESAPRPDT